VLGNLKEERSDCFILATTKTRLACVSMQGVCLGIGMLGFGGFMFYVLCFMVEIMGSIALHDSKQLEQAAFLWG
jgi:hypothetical protein